MNMSKSGQEWKVGVFVTIGLVLLAVLLLQFSKGMTFFKPTYDIVLKATDVGGLKPRAGVLMSGVQIGTVSDIQLADDSKSVAIRLRILSRYKICKDAQFVIQQSGFLGDQYVGIVPRENKAEPFANGETATAEAPFDLQSFTRSASGFLQHIDDTARKLNESLVDVRQLLLNPQTLTNLATAAANLRVVSERAIGTVDEINAVLATNGPALRASGSNLVLFSEDMDRFARGLNEVLETNRPGFQTVVKNLETSTETIKDLLDNVQAGKGPAGVLFKNESMATNMARIAENLSITTSNLNRVGLWGILWKHRAPKPDRAASRKP